MKALHPNIQSGNIVLKSVDDPSNKVHNLVLENYGFAPDVFVLNELSFSKSVENNPYSAFEGKFVHRMSLGFIKYEF